jgi:hypothetical protein
LVWCGALWCVVVVFVFSAHFTCFFSVLYLLRRIRYCTDLTLHSSPVSLCLFIPYHVSPLQYSAVQYYVTQWCPPLQVIFMYIFVLIHFFFLLSSRFLLYHILMMFCYILLFNFLRRHLNFAFYLFRCFIGLFLCAFSSAFFTAPFLEFFIFHFSYSWQDSVLLTSDTW